MQYWSRRLYVAKIFEFYKFLFFTTHDTTHDLICVEAYNEFIKLMTSSAASTFFSQGFL